MKKETKIKIILGIIYIIIVSGFLWLFFSKFSLSELISYDFIKNNKEYLDELKNKNFFLVSFLFFLLTIIWVMLLGFGSPVIILGGFIFGKFIGSVYAVLGLTIGATFLYIFSNYFLKDLVKEKFEKRFSNLNNKFKKNEFIFFLIYRFVGGIPFFISNILPTIFNVRVNNFFFGSILGMYPQIFIWASFGAGLEKVIENNLNAPSLTQIILSKEIYIPMIGFMILLILGIIVKNIFYNK